MDASDSEISSVKSRSFLLITGLTILSALFITTLAVNHELHDPVRTGKIFLFARWMVLVIPVGLFIFIRTWKQPFSHLSLLVLIWGSWIFLRGKNGGIWHDEKFFWFAGCFIFFFLAVSLLQTAKKDNREWLILIPVLIISLIAAIEAILGQLQLYGGYRVYHAAFKVTGTFFNPAPYGGFLLRSLPMALLLTSIRDHRFYRKIIRWAGWFAAALILVIIPSTQSRAAFLGTLTALCVWTFFRYKPILWLKIILRTKRNRIFAGIFIPVVFVILFGGFYLFKKDSADGRLLIWKVAAQTIKENPFTGHGFNTVQATLAPAQAAYFASGKGSEGEQMLAGSVRWVFKSIFLQQYGKSLYMEGRHEQAVSILTEAGKSYKDEFSFIILGDGYKAVGEYGKAEDQYLLAASMVPHKFYPRYLLVKLYDETGQREKAVITAKELLEKEIKVESTAIEEIQAEMLKILNK